MLGEQLENMEPMLGELESSLETSQKKLNEETKLRRQLEQRYVESADLREENESLRHQCETLKIELGWKQENPASSETEHNGALVGDKMYTEVLNELEAVTEQLVSTQQKLWITEDKLRQSQNKGEGRKALMDLAENDTFDVTVTSSDSKFSEELGQVKEELEEAHRGLKAVGEKAKLAQAKTRAARQNANSGSGRGQNTGISREVYNYEVGELRRHVVYLEESVVTTKEKLEKCQNDYEACRDQNEILVEEIACLREVLQDQTDKEIDEAHIKEELQKTLTAEADKRREKELAEANKLREREINALRVQLKKIIKDNSFLKEHVDRLEEGIPEDQDEQVLDLKKEVTRLRRALNQVEEKNTYVTQESDIDWHLKLERLREELENEKELAVKELRAEMKWERDVAVQALQDRVEQLSDEKSGLEDKVESLQKELRLQKKEKLKLEEEVSEATGILNDCRDEVLVLKKRGGILNSDLEHTKRKLQKVEAEAREARDRYADVCAELEVTRQILHESGLNGEMVPREDETELKREIHSLGKNLEQLRQDYAELENEFLDSQHRFCDSQEEAARKAVDEVHYLTGKVSEMEAALEVARADYSEMAAKFEDARRECQESFKKGEKQGLDGILRVLRAQKSHSRAFDSKDTEIDDLNVQISELTIQLENTRAELRECKTVLQASNIEAPKMKQSVTDNSSESSDEYDSTFHDQATTKARGGTHAESLADEEEGTEVRLASSTGTRESGDLHSSFLSVIRENSILKEKLESHDSSIDHRGFKQGGIEAERVREVIRDLELALKANESTSDELDRVSRKLDATEKKLQSAFRAVDASNDEKDRLNEQVRDLKNALSDARENLNATSLELTESKSREKCEKQEKIRKGESMNEVQMILDAERNEEFHELRERLKDLTEEKASLQHQLDDTKIALSVSQYAHERNKEELRLSETRLSKYSEDIYRLKHELNTMSRSLSDVKHAYDDVLDELKLERLSNHEDPQKTESKLSAQLEQLVDDNSSLQETVSELEETLKHTQGELATKTKQVSSLHDTLLSAQKETRLLTEEISNITTAFEASKAEYNSVVDELEAVCELFEEAQKEAERTGKEAAIREIRTEIKGSHQKERQALREQAKRILKENGNLKKKLSGVENELARAQSNPRNNEQVSAMNQEIQILQEALRKSDEEVIALREREFNMNLALKNSKVELKHARSELELANQSFDGSRRATERTARASAVEEFVLMENNSELKALREKLKRLIDESTMNSYQTTAGNSTKVQKSDAMESRVAQMRIETETQGSTTVDKTLRTENNTDDEESGRQGPAVKFNTEMISLQGKLAKMEGALEASRKTENEQKAVIEQMKRESGEIAGKAELLELANMRLEGESESLRKDINLRKDQRSTVTDEIDQVKNRLEEKTAAKENEAAESTASTTSERDAEIRLLREEFKKLTSKSLKLSKQVEDAEAAVSQIRAKQERTRGEADLRRKQAEELQLKVGKAMEERTKQDEEMGLLSRTMENRVSTAEVNLGQLEQDVLVVKDQVQLTKVGLDELQQTPESKVEQRESSNHDEDSSTSMAEDDKSRCREDSNAKSSREAPPISQAPSTKEANLTERALEAIALSKKKNQMRKQNLHEWQSRFLGALPAPGTEVPDMSSEDARE